MSDLRALLEMMTTKPELHERDGISVAVSGDHTTQFANETEAKLFVACVRELPAILDELEARRASDPDARISFLERALDLADENYKLLEQRFNETETRLLAETKARTAAQVRARNLAVALRGLKNAMK